MGERAVRRILPVILLLLLAGLFCGCGTEDSLTVGILPDIDSIPLMVAKQQGFWDDPVKLELYKSPVERDSAFYSGNLDGAVSDCLAAALAKEGGFPVLAVSKTNGSYSLIAGAGSGLVSLSDLRGKSVGLSTNTVIEYVTDSLLQAENLNADTIVKTSVPKIPSRLELLQNGKLDAACLPEPYASAAEKSGGRVLGSSSQLSVNPGVLLFTEETITNHPEELRKFYQGYDRAAEWLNSHKTPADLEPIFEELGLPDAARDMALPVYEAAAAPDKAELTRAVGWLKQKELIKNTYPYDQLVDDFLTK